MKMSQVIVFDFDGTLVDTKRAYIEMMGRAFDKFNLKIKSEDVAKTLVPTIRGTIERLLMRTKRYEAQLVSSLEEETIELLSSLWVQHLKVDDDIIELLEKLRENNCKLYLASNSHSSFVLPALKKLKLKQYFVEIITLDSGLESKRDMLVAVAHNSGIKVQDLTYIGDTIMDVELADSLGCKLIVLLTPRSWDFDKKRQLKKAASGCEKIRIVNGIQGAEKELLGSY